MAFGSAIRKLREEAGISVDKLTEKIGVKASRWRKWEEKDFDPRDEDRAKIEAFFGMRLSEIINLVDIRKFIQVPNKNETGADEFEGVQELSSGQIMSMLAKANERFAETLAIQARMLDRIESKMARGDTQARMEVNLNRVYAGLEAVGDRQDRAIKQIAADLAEIKRKIDGLS